MSEQESSETKSVDHFQFVCKQCGFELDHEIGHNSLVCQSCGEVEPIETESFNIFHANAYESTVLNLRQQEPSEAQHHVRCDTCGAGFDLAKDTHADECPYCGSNIVVPVNLQRQLLPDAIIPFDVKEIQANESFQKWIKGLWFAPNSLKRLAMRKHPIQGTYIPYWGFDANTYSQYSGQRGTNYTTTVTVRVNGKTQTRLVTKIRWRSVSGHVSHEFDNVLVPASELLSQKLTSSMKKWDLAKSQNYSPKYLSGYKSELYQIGLPRAYKYSQDIMTRYIRRLVRRDIGGDHQRISSLSTRYERVGFKLMLMPLWVSAFLYNKKTFQFIINGQTGEVKGERPYSWVKIVSLVLFIAAVGAGIYFAQDR